MNAFFKSLLNLLSKLTKFSSQNVNAFTIRVAITVTNVVHFTTNAPIAWVTTRTKIVAKNVNVTAMLQNVVTVKISKSAV